MNELIDGVNSFVIGRAYPATGAAQIDFSAQKSVEFDPKIGAVGTRWRPVKEPVQGSATLENRAAGGPAIESSASRNFLGRYKRFVPVAEVYASMSKMPGTKVGCVVVATTLEQLTSGWNGAARGSRADIDGRLDTRESRLDWVVHAEANAIANAARGGRSLVGSVMVCTLMPCMTCAKLTVQAGITAVLCPAPTDDENVRWGKEFNLTRELFRECGVALVHYDQPL